MKFEIDPRGNGYWGVLAIDDPAQHAVASILHIPLWDAGLSVVETWELNRLFVPGMESAESIAGTATSLLRRWYAYAARDGASRSGEDRDHSDLLCDTRIFLLASELPTELK